MSPLTLGTAGHVDHGKTTLVEALTGVWADRLPEERARGLTIALGYAPLELPGGRRLSVIDVPGHERFVRTMVAGATGIDLFLLVVAADDGPMPQTLEHLAVLRALGVSRGVVAITKTDVSNPGPATAAIRELLPGVPVVPCSARSGEGLGGLRAALAEVAADVAARRAERAGASSSFPTGGVDAGCADGASHTAGGSEAVGAAPVLHVDRAFTIAGRGTVVTGTAWDGVLRVGDRLVLEPGARPVRVRGLQVHDEPREEAAAGQRVAVNLLGVRARDVARGDVLTLPGTVGERLVLDCALALEGAEHGRRVQVHHGTRDVPGRLVALEEDLWQLRLEQPLLARDADRVVVRRHAPPDTLGGGRILDAAAGRHGRRPEVLERLRALRDGRPAPSRPGGVSPRSRSRAHTLPVEAERRELSGEATALAGRLWAAGAALLPEAELDSAALRELRAVGRAVRVAGRRYGDAGAVEQASTRILGEIDAQGSISLGEVKVLLGVSRAPAQALLEHLDAERATVRRPDDRRVRRGSAVAR